MKLNKEEREDIIKKLKSLFREQGYKGGKELAYRKQGENFICIRYSIVDRKRLSIMLDIKKYTYDEWFWDIMDMSDNRKMGDSFRSIGACVSPSIIIADFLKEPEVFSDMFLRDCVEKVQSQLESFVTKHDINEYVLSGTDFEDGGKLLDGNLLKCLAYCDLGNVSAAKKIEKEEVQKGRDGGFENEGKSFFEWMLLYNGPGQ